MHEMANTQDFVLAAKRGDSDAFKALVRLETPDAFRLCLAILRHPSDAEDALQEAFCRAWRDLPDLRDAERWPAWFRRLTVRAAFDTARRRKASRIVPFADHEPPPVSDCSAGVSRRDEVLRAMSRLDANDRALLALRFGQDMELPDAAAVLGIPLGTAKSRLHRALGRMRNELESVDGHGESPAGSARSRIEPTTESGL